MQNIVPRGKIETNKKTRVGKLRKHHKKKKEKKKTSIRRSSMSGLAIKPGHKTRFNSTVQPTFIETTPCKKARRDFRFSKPSSETKRVRGAVPKHGKTWFGESRTAANNYVITAIRGGGEAVCNRARLRYTDVGRLFPLTIDQCIITRE